MELPINFQSLDRIKGREGRSKLLHQDSKLYQLLHGLKQRVSQEYEVGADRMDLHIEITSERRDPAFRQKAESLEGKTIRLDDTANWGFLGRAFVLWTPEVKNYGRTHVTISFFGNHPRPSQQQLNELVQTFLNQQVIS